MFRGQATRSVSRAGSALLVALLAVGSLWLAAPAGAATVTIDGTIDSSSPVVDPTGTIVTPNCTGGYVAFAVHAAVYTVIPQVSGAHTISEPGSDSAVYVIDGAADLSAIADNCIAASNTNPINLSVDLTAGQRYDVVVIDDTFVQDGMDYSLSIDGEVAPLVGPTDLGVTLAETAPGPHAPGDTVGLTATVTNASNVPTIDASATVTLPAGFDPASISGVTASAGYTCVTDPVAGTLTCSLAEHPAGAAATIAFQAKILTTATSGTYTVSAVAETPAPEADDTNNTATLGVVVVAPAAVIVQPRFTG